MDDFKHIKIDWAQRSIPEMPKDGYRKVIENSLYIKRKQLMGQLVLIATVIILIYFFIYVSGFKNARLTLGILLMVGSLLFRVGVEFFSKVKLKSLTPTLQVEEFSQKILAYYKSRLLIHYVFTPLSFVAYVIGFISMLPVFKISLSSGFYNYIIISSILIFLALIGLICTQIKKELRMIKEMEREGATDIL